MIEKIEAYLRSHLSFPDDKYYLPLALFAALEHCWFECFDEVPYLSVAAALKGAGKTRVLELLQFLGGDEKVTIEDGSITMAALYTKIDQKKVILMDEAERFNNASSTFRPILNGGYRRGQTLSRKIGGQTVEFSTYSPKGFAAIGDLYDSLRDRCIVVLMTRIQGGERKEFVRKLAKAEGNALAAALNKVVEEERENIADVYTRYEEDYPSLDFLADRDREIWKPLFALCQVLAPGRTRELARYAVDISTLKTLPIRRMSELRDEERKAAEVQYAERLVRDAITVMNGQDKMTTSDLIRGLRALDTSPWRSYRGTGITDDAAGTMLMAGLLSHFGVEPKTIRVKPKSEPKSTAKGYVRSDLVAGAERFGIQVPMPISSNPVTQTAHDSGRDDEQPLDAASSVPKKPSASVKGDVNRSSVHMPEAQLLRLDGCGGCRELHHGIHAKHVKHPDWDDRRLADECGTTLTIVRQALTRFGRVSTKGRAS